jgi:RimJ/RimL family protein N-acetyltransferase
MIESERLLLRRPEQKDFEATATMFAEAAVVKYMGGQPLDRPAAWGKFLRDLGHWTIEPFGLFSVIEKATGHYVGKVGFARFERHLGEQANTSIEMSWTLRSCFHGKGIAFEAAHTAQRWFDERTETTRTACVIAPLNIPSRKLAARLGYKETGPIARPESDNLLLLRDTRW